MRLKHVSLLNGKIHHPPTVGCWLHKVEEINKLEDLTVSAQNKHEAYSELWRLWNMFIFSEEGLTLLNSNGRT